MLLSYEKEPLFSKPLVRLIPVFATTDFHQQRHVNLGLVFHQLVDLFRDAFEVLFLLFLHQFIVYLHDHTHTLLLGLQPSVPRNHR